MARNTRNKASRTAKLAAPYRELLKNLIREKIRTEEDKRELAKFLNRSVSFVNQLVYYGEGGMDAWLGALTFSHHMDPVKAEAFLRRIGNARRLGKPQTT